MNNIVSDYLKLNNFNYTHSIFLNEGKINSSPLSNSEIFEYFSQKSKIFKNSEIQNFEKNSILENLLEVLYDKSLSKDFVNTHTQTEFDFEKNNVNAQLKNLDDNFMNKLSYYKLSTISNAEEQMNSYKRNLEARFQEDLKAEVFFLKKF